MSCLVFFIAVAFVIAFLPGSADRFIDPDSKDYILLADSLAAGHGYFHDGQPEIFRAPGYPFFLTPFRYFFPNTVLPVIIVQILLGTCSLFLLWRLVLTVFDDTRIAKLALLFQLFSVTSLVFINKVLSETLFTFLLLLLLLLSENLLKNLRDSQDTAVRFSGKNILITLLCGVIAGLLGFIRAIFLPLFLLYLLYMLVSFLNIKRHSDQQSFLIPKAVLFLLLLILPFSIFIGSWTVRNIKVANYAGFSSVGTINIYRYYACALMASNNDRSFAEQQAICDANLAKCSNQQEQATYSLKHGLPEIKKSPLKYMLLHLKSDMNTLLPAVGDLYALLGFKIGGKGTLSVINSQGILAGIKHYFAGNWGLFIIALPLVAILFIKYLSAVVGCFSVFKPKFNLTLCFYALAIIYLIVIPGAVSHPRFRVPVEPLLSLFAALGVINLRDLYCRLKNRSTDS